MGARNPGAQRGTGDAAALLAVLISLIISPPFFLKRLFAAHLICSFYLY